MTRPTVCQALDMLHDLLRRLSTRHLPSGRLSGPDGSLRLIVPQYSFADFADLAIQEIWRYGSDAAQVPGRIRSMLADLSAAALPEHLPILRHRKLGKRATRLVAAPCVVPAPRADDPPGLRAATARAAVRPTAGSGLPNRAGSNMSYCD